MEISVLKVEFQITGDDGVFDTYYRENWLLLKKEKSLVLSHSRL